MSLCTPLTLHLFHGPPCACFPPPPLSDLPICLLWRCAVSAGVRRRRNCGASLWRSSRRMRVRLRSSSPPSRRRSRAHRATVASWRAPPCMCPLGVCVWCQRWRPVSLSLVCLDPIAWVPSSSSSFSFFFFSSFGCAPNGPRARQARPPADACGPPLRGGVGCPSDPHRRLRWVPSPSRPARACGRHHAHARGGRPSPLPPVGNARPPLCRRAVAHARVEGDRGGGSPARPPFQPSPASTWPRCPIEQGHPPLLPPRNSHAPAPHLP